MATDTHDLDDLTPYQRRGFVSVTTDEGIWHLARNEYDALETAILQNKEVFIGHNNYGNTVVIRLRRGAELAVDCVIDWTAEALAEQKAEQAAQKFRDD